MVAPSCGGVFADLAAAWGGVHRKPAASLDELLQEVPAEQRDEVKAFLREQELEELEDLAAVTVGDLTEAFKAKPAGFTLGHRSAVRSLRTLAQEGQEAAAAAAAGQARRERWASCGRSALMAALLVALGFVNCFVNAAGLGPLYDEYSWDENRCNGFADGTSSGLKVIVAGFDGTGSQPVLDALMQMGVKSYSRADFSFFVWSGLAGDFWRRRENGRLRRPPWPRPSSLSALLEMPLKELWGTATYRPLSADDIRVLNGTQPGDLAAAVARCGVGAVALDGIERLTWPLYSVSDGVKVISLSSTAYKDYLQRTNAPPGLELGNLASALISASQYVLPWGVAFKAFDIANELPAARFLSQGGVLFGEVASAQTAFLYTAEYLHRIRRHAYGGLSMRPDRANYDWFYKNIRRQVPESRLLEFDPARHTWQDLCAFLEVSHCPQAGHLAQGHADGWTWLAWDDHSTLVLYIMLWVVNWQVVSFLLRILRGPVLLATKPARVVLWRLRLLVNPIVFAKFFMAMSVAAYCEAYDFWGQWPTWTETCQGPALPNNESGVKVMVAGLAKSGTRTMSRTLWQLGMDGSYHSEELSLYYWGPHHLEYWMRPENGGKYPGPSFSRAHDFSKAFAQSDPEVLRETTPQDLAAGLSRCGVDAIAFDCIEGLFWPIYNVSPGVKVISLSWRTWEEYLKSMTEFHKDFNMMCTSIGQLQAAVHGLPWAWLTKQLEPLVGSPISKMLQEGRPAACQVFPPWLSWFHGLVGGKRILSHWYSGLAYLATDEASYNGFYDEVRQRVPKDRLFEWHMKKHKWEDLCKFLEVDPCPRSGKLDRAINVFNFERDFPVCFLSKVHIYLLLMAINWRVYGFALNCVVAVVKGFFFLAMALKRCMGLGSSEKEEEAL